jgi:hypothetical protein
MSFRFFKMLGGYSLTSSIVNFIRLMGSAVDAIEVLKVLPQGDLAAFE